MTPSAASDSVIECATVNAVTTLNTSQNAALKLGAAVHVTPDSRPHEHRRQQQRQQEQDVVEPRPDVQHAFLQVVGELLALRQFGQRELLHRRIGAQDAGARRTLRGKVEQPAMLRIDVEEQPIADLEHLRRRRAGRGEAQHRVGAVAVIVDELLAQHRHASRIGRAERQSRQRVGGDLRVLRLHLAPGDRAILVASRPSAKSRSRSAMSHWPSIVSPSTLSVR